MGRSAVVVAQAPTRRSVVWWAVLAVAACGVVATAHGVYEVARAAGVGREVAALYVPITDGLALAAYSATTRLRRGRGYAWLVVVAAAGLSGLAQAVNLAGLGDPDWRLRAGVGAWPAVAVAVAAHLLWLAGRPRAGTEEVGHEREVGSARAGEAARGRDEPGQGDGSAAVVLHEGRSAAQRGDDDRGVRGGGQLDDGAGAAEAVAPDSLVLAARAVAAHLGPKLSRRSLIAGLRARGHKVSTDRASDLLAQLRDAA